MEKKINIAELLKDCPKGMELDCTIYSNVTFIGINKGVFSTIKVQTEEGVMHLTECGCYAKCETAKCVIFPKGKTTWEGFQRPFKDGDVVFYNDTIAIFKEWGDETLFRTYVTKYLCCDSLIDVDVPLFGKGVRKEIRLATKEEKQKLFQAIKDNGYKWNAEKKCLEKLIELKFKVGDKITEIGGSRKGEIFYIDVDKYHVAVSNTIGIDVFFEDQDKWELIPNKFSITSLKAFDKVLVRDKIDDIWMIDFYGFFKQESKYPFKCHGQSIAGYKQCIPYEGNEHLLGTADDCDEYYKTWEE